jgi:hypothetical protein
MAENRLANVDRRLVGGKLYKYHRQTRLKLPAHLPENSPQFIEEWAAAERMAAELEAANRETSPLRAVLRRAKERSIRRRYEFNLDAVWFVKKIKSQRMRCALSGMRFDYDKEHNGKMPRAPSIDRIDCAKGYTPENCRIVCSIVNLARLDWSDQTFLEMCEAVAKHRKRHANDM